MKMKSGERKKNEIRCSSTTKERRIGIGTNSCEKDAHARMNAMFICLRDMRLTLCLCPALHAHPTIFSHFSLYCVRIVSIHIAHTHTHTPNEDWIEYILCAVRFRSFAHVPFAFEKAKLNYVLYKVLLLHDNLVDYLMVIDAFLPPSLSLSLHPPAVLLLFLDAVHFYSFGAGFRAEFGILFRLFSLDSLYVVQSVVIFFCSLCPDPSVMGSLEGECCFGSASDEWMKYHAKCSSQ